MTRKTDPLPVLVLSKSDGETEGFATFQDGCRTEFLFVRRFDRKKVKLDSQKEKQLSAIAKLLALSSGQKIDFSLIQEGFRTLVADAFPAELADAISAKGRDGWALATTTGNPIKWCERWVPALFNRAIKKAQLVMWSPDGGVLSPAIFCPDTETAMYASLFIGRSFYGLRACIGCGVLFPSRTNKFFHDTKCADRHRHKRFHMKKGKER